MRVVWNLFQLLTTIPCPNQCVLVFLSHGTCQACDVRGDCFVWLFILFCHLTSKFRMGCIGGWRISRKQENGFPRWIKSITSPSQGFGRGPLPNVQSGLMLRFRESHSLKCSSRFKQVITFTQVVKSNYVKRKASSSHKVVGADGVLEGGGLTIREAVALSCWDVSHRSQELGGVFQAGGSVWISTFNRKHNPSRSPACSAVVVRSLR